MNCDYCGAPLNLEDEKCPHCGHVNEHARIHARDMEHYKTEFEETKSEVKETVGRYKGLTARLVVLFAVIIFTIVMFVIWTGEYNIYRNHVIRQTKANRKTICETADEYLENRDYVSFMVYADEHMLCDYRLQNDSDFGKYYPLGNAVQNYNYIYSGVMQIVFANGDLDDYYAENIQEYVDELYDKIEDQDSFIWDYGDPDFTRQIYSEISESVDGLFMAYLDFSAEDIESLHTMTGSHRDVLIEDKVAEAMDRNREKAENADAEEDYLDELRDEMTYEQ